MSAADQGRGGTSWLKKTLLGTTLATVLTAGLLLGLELALRIGDYGHAPGFWREETDEGGKRWIRENWWVTVPYFAPELVRRPQAFRLPADKPADSYRVFVLGSSAAMGDPEPSFSISRVLQVLLDEAYPGVRFEIVNAGITAVNSHVVRGVAEDCAGLKPDLFFVYEGNNEVIGPFGPGTVFSSSLRSERAIRISVLLRSLRLGQLLASTVRGGTSSDRLKEWGGMEMFLKHEIPATDPRLQDTRHLFAQNLRAIVRAGQGAGARVVLGTVLTNQRDFSPFRSLHRADIAAPEKERFTTSMQAGIAAAEAGDLPAAERHFTDSLKEDASYAEAHYQLGRVLLAANKPRLARDAFRRALDLDALRFRTDSGLNDAIRSVAAGMEGVWLLDGEQVGEGEVQSGVPGDEFLYEHVHLTFRGTYLIARELFSLVGEDLKARGRVPPDRVVAPLPIDSVRQRLAFTTYEQAMIGKELLDRLQRPPFTLQSSNPARLASVSRRDARASQLLARPEAGEAMRQIYEQAAASSPGDWVLRRNFGMAMVALGLPEQGLAQLEEAAKTIPDDPDLLYGLMMANQRLGRTEPAAAAEAALRRLVPLYLEAAARK